MENKNIKPLAPYIPNTAKILILGSFPSPKSREIGFYYGHPQNRFWKILSTIFEKELPISIQDKKELLNQLRIGLWDVVSQCEIAGADDSSIRKPEINDFSLVFGEKKIEKVFTTGKVATTLFKKYCESKYGINAEYLPSTSPANCRVKDKDILTAYRILLG